MPLFTLDNIKVSSPNSFGLDAVLKAPDGVSKGLQMLHDTFHDSSMAAASERQHQVEADWNSMIQNGTSIPDAYKALRENAKYNADDLANAKIDLLMKNAVEEERAKAKDKREDVRLGYEGDRVKVAEGELGLLKAKFAAEQKEKELDRQNTLLVNRYQQLLLIDPAAAAAFYEQHKEQLQSADFAKAGSLIMADMAKNGYMPVYGSETAVPEGYQITPGRVNATISNLDNEASSYGAATGYYKWKADPNSEDLDKVKATQISRYKDKPEMLGRVEDEFNAAIRILDAAGIPRDMQAYVMKYAAENNRFLDGFHYDTNRIEKVAKEINETSKKSGGVIRNLMQSSKYLSDSLDAKSAANLTNIAAAEQTSYRKLKAAKDKGWISDKEFEEASKQVRAKAYQASLPAQNIINASEQFKTARNYGEQAQAKIANLDKDITEIKTGKKPSSNPEAEIAGLLKIKEELQKEAEASKANAERASALLSGYQPY